MLTLFDSTRSKRKSHGNLEDWKKNHYTDFHTQYKSNATTAEDKAHNKAIVGNLDINYLKNPLPNWNTALHVLAAEGDNECLNILLNKGADIEVKAMGLNLLHCALVSQNLETVQLILRHARQQLIENVYYFNQARWQSFIDAQNFYGYTPLHEAAKKGCVEIAELLLGCDANVNEHANNGVTPLHLAYISDNNKNEMIQLLLNNNADPQAKDRSGHIPAEFIAEPDQQALTPAYLYRPRF